MFSDKTLQPNKVGRDEEPQQIADRRLLAGCEYTRLAKDTPEKEASHFKMRTGC